MDRRSLPAEASGARLRNSPAEWFASAAIGAAVFFFMWAYHDWWRGKSYSWPTAGECLALAALFNLSLCQALGPMCRLSGLCPGALGWRRPLGLTSAAFACGHVVITLTMLTGKFDWAFYRSNPWMLVFGILSGLLLAALTILSFSWASRRLGAKLWGMLMQLGYLALLFTLLHFMVLGKHGKWAQWFEKRDLPAPPGTLPLFCIGALCLLPKAVELMVRALRGRKPEN